MSRRHYNISDQEAIGFLVSQTSSIEAQVVEVQYPDIQYPQLIPVDTSANEWAKSVTYYSTDKTGKAGWFAARANDIHVADINRAKHEVGIEMADIGYRYDIEELGQAMMVPGTNLTADRALAARRAYEEFVDDVALRGKGEKAMYGIMNYPGITTVLAGIQNTHTTWDQKDADGITADINSALTGVYVNSLTVEMADTILLPVGAITILGTKRIPNTTASVLDYIRTNNVYTQTTGQPLTIRALRGLETAGQNGSGRMVVYRRDPQVLKMHIPMTHRFLNVFQTAPLVFDVPGIFRLAGLEIRRPGAVRYIDGILTSDQLS
jgi:hypothetical protein